MGGVLTLTYDRKCAPRLSPEAAETLSSHFVTIRRQVHSAELSANARSSIPITVRQLEAIIRITESLAKLVSNPFSISLSSPFRWHQDFQPRDSALESQS